MAAYSPSLSMVKENKCLYKVKPFLFSAVLTYCIYATSGPSCCDSLTITPIYRS
jgi:hypothetical protein